MGRSEGRCCPVVGVLVERFFFLTRLPPRLEEPRIHSRFSLIHREHGGVPPDTSLDKSQLQTQKLFHVGNSGGMRFEDQKPVQGASGMPGAVSDPDCANKWTHIVKLRAERFDCATY